MGKIWQGNKETKKPAVLSKKEKKLAKHAKKEAHVVTQWNTRDLVTPKSH